MFFIEVRSVGDELFGKGTALGNNAFFTDHYRRFIVLDEITDNLQQNGFSILYSLKSTGLAPYKTADPMVIRLVAQNRIHDLVTPQNDPDIYHNLLLQSIRIIISLFGIFNSSNS